MITPADEVKSGAVSKMGNVSVSCHGSMPRDRNALDKIAVAHNDFKAAVSLLPKMKRAPRGSFGNKIPKDTLLYESNGQFVVSTPAAKSVIEMTGNWSVCVSIRLLPSRPSWLIGLKLHPHSPFFRFDTWQGLLPSADLSLSRWRRTGNVDGQHGALVKVQ